MAAIGRRLASLFLLLLVFVAVWETKADVAAHVNVSKLEKMLSPIANRTLHDLFNGCLNQSDWKLKILQRISKQRDYLAKLKEESKEKNLEDTIRKIKDELRDDLLVSSEDYSHKTMGKYKKQYRYSDGDGEKEDVLNRRKRSEPHGAGAGAGNGNGAGSATGSTATSDITSSQSPLNSHSPAHSESVPETTTAHNQIGAITSTCPAQYNHCVYGDCIDLGFDIFTCNCYEGYAGMSCEIIDVQIVLNDLPVAALYGSPEELAATNPNAYAATVALAQYLAGDLPNYL